MRRLSQFPCERVFAPAAANDQNFHGEFVLTVEAAVSAAKAFEIAGDTPAATVAR
jgi:hypothetical protein